MDAPRISLDLDAGRATIRPQGWLGGGSAWTSYKAACRQAGCRPVKDSAGQWMDVCTIEQVPGTIAALAAANFAPVLTERLAAAVRALAGEVQAASAAAIERLTASEERLASLGTGLALYPFQREGVRWLAGMAEAVLGDEQGLGKTVQALIASPEHPEGTPMLCVVPANVKGNWIREAIRWRPDLMPTMLSGRGSFRWPRRGELVSINYDLLPKCVAQGREYVLPPEAGRPLPGTVLVFDELHKAKAGSKTQRGRATRAMRKAVQAAGAGRVWGLTGTPLVNYPPELWNVLEILGCAEKAYGSWPNFVRIAGGVKTRWGIDWRKDRMDVPALQEGLRRVCLRRMVDDTVDLPPIVTREIKVDIDDATRRMVDEAMARAKAAGMDFEAVAAALADADDEAKIITGGGVGFEELSRVRSLLAKAKIAALDDLVDEYEEPLIVFSAHRAPIEHVAKRDGWAMIVGGVDAVKRTQIVADYEAGLLKGVALTFGAGAEGITLVRGRRMIEVDWPWTSAALAQSRARFRRIGQKASTLFVDVLVANHPADELVHSLVAWKAEIIARAVDSARIGGREAAPVAPIVEAVDVLDVVEVVAEHQVKPATTPQEVEQRQQAERRQRFQLRGPKDDVERWAVRGCLILAGLDPDGAREQNGVGFNGTDSGYGRWLAGQLAHGGELGERHWSAMVKMLAKYHRQVGKKPEPENGAAA